MSEKVLITGASGFLGFHLVKAAKKAGYTVHAAVRHSSTVAHLSKVAPVYVYPDFSSPEKLKELIQQHGYQYIIHAAGSTAASNEAAYMQVNATYTKNLAEAAAAAGVKRFVMLSSLAAIGPAHAADAAPLQEVHTPNPVDSYGRSKLQAEKYLAEVENLEITILRPTAVYGPREKDIFILFKALKRGLEPYMGRSPQAYSFVYGPDLARLCVDALTAPHFGTYNISDGNVYNRYELAALAKEFMKKRTLKFHLPLPLVRLVASLLEATHKRKPPALNREKVVILTAAGWQCDITKARQELNFSPQHNLRQGLQKTIAWYKKENWL